MNIFTKSAIASITFLVMAVVVIVMAFSFGPAIERITNPVVTTADVVPIPSGPDALRILLISVKQRETCELINRVVSVRVGPNTWVRGTALFKDQVTGNFVELGRTRPAGDRIIDELYIKPKGVGIHIVLSHRCHPFWITPTTQTYIETIQTK